MVGSQDSVQVVEDCRLRLLERTTTGATIASAAAATAVVLLLLAMGIEVVGNPKKKFTG